MVVAEATRRGPGDTPKTVDAQLILDTAAALLERDGVAGFSMRALSEHLGVAVTSIYWHVGGRDKLFDALIDRLIEVMASLPAVGVTPADRIAALARAQRIALIERQHLMAIAHERDRTPSLFQPVQQTLAAELAALGITGTQAALALRSIEVHVISSALMQFSAIRGGDHDEEDPSLWGDDWPDQKLVDALRSPTDYDAVFEYGLAALLASLV
ncbi:TetR/AcrR family transcriptional regulator [Mycobacterium sp. CBMA293]|nr:TetR/AcrR family transcriptional regulator [Mycolicibacterium sp. CBMA 360]MUL58409.1 TetR/AcrR family transcriptional regulator [Mycolicibacterium sp. CBMA 335]MUL73867.1 TetR/AcrR family transcriptional regulator [Mycolicibacterium sp. CBMA 311]MUL93292.1 TetR/AcrR family transcriptional regulator [Mycolicibacterium sp. CBMA 230]MUM07839.1 TetR family transcriptional regulator [Mycolicibacterium sp. CBMA 213]MUM10135.1 TetR/AcrR family transcriptional regulator [Mycolicibacterium sp. CBMA